MMAASMVQASQQPVSLTNHPISMLPLPGNTPSLGATPGLTPSPPRWALCGCSRMHARVESHGLASPRARALRQAPQRLALNRAPAPCSQLARKARRKELEAALRARGLRASLAVESHFLERWWKVDLFVARRYQPVGVQAAIDGALRLVRAALAGVRGACARGRVVPRAGAAPLVCGGASGGNQLGLRLAKARPSTRRTLHPRPRPPRCAGRRTRGAPARTSSSACSRRKACPTSRA